MLSVQWCVGAMYYNQTYLGHAILLLSAPIYQLTRHIMSQSCSPPILGEIDNLLTYVRFGENFMMIRFGKVI